MEILKNEIQLGLPKPVRVLHVTDAHVCLADERDSETTQKLAADRSRVFDGSEPDRCRRRLYEHLDYGVRNCDVLVCTGDVLDFISRPGCEWLKSLCDRYDTMLFAVGNHEFARQLGENEDFYYKMHSYTQIQNCTRYNLDFASTVKGGVNFITLDDVYYDFTEKQYELLKRECEREYPVVLCMHTPIYHEKYFDDIQAGDPAHVTYLCGCPEEKIRHYPEFRYHQQLANDMTLKFCDYVVHQPKIKAILTGHTHANYECRFENGLIQLVSAGTYQDFSREVIFC